MEPSAQQGRDAVDPFPPISDYAIIGDGRTLALISSAGAVEWLCLPDLDDGALFAAMLDRRAGGTFAVSCLGGRPSARRYRPLTNVLETEFRSPDGEVRLTDAMPVSNITRHSMAPQRELLRIVEALSGNPEIEVRYRPAPDFHRIHDGLHRRGVLGWALHCGGSLYLLRADLELTPDGEGGLYARARLAPGKPVVLSLSFENTMPAVIPLLGTAARDRVTETEQFWKDWISACTFEGPYREPVLRSLLALKLLQFSLSGAMAAAATTSLPETLGGSRNWDYRFCWLRDASFVLRAFVDIGYWREGQAFFDWLMHSTRLSHPRLQPLYTLFGRRRAPERTLAQFTGYCGSRPVRIGNAAATQFQLDAYGGLIGAARDFVARGHELDSREESLLVQVGRMVCRHWREPDNGIWEFRGARHHHTYSKARAWAGLDDLVWLADHHGLNAPRVLFQAERDAIKDEIMNKGVHEGQARFKGAFDTDYIDAALLLLPRLHFIEPSHPLMLGTWKAIAENLCDRGMVRRYTTEIDAMPGREGAFVVCGFWEAEYLARAGRLDEACRQFECLLEYANPLGLYSEEYDVDEGKMLGNFPQAFSHTGLISAALAIESARAAARGAA